MKHHSFIAIIACLILSNMLCIAQPTITAASNPQIGQRWNAVLLDPTGFDPGAAGANQTWNYGTLTPFAGIPPFEFEIVAPEDAPMNSDYPTATHAIKWAVVGFEFYQYEYSDNNGRTVLGGVTAEGGVAQSTALYTDEDDAMKYPLSYQTTYDFSALQSVTGFGFTTDYEIEGSVEADAYGTLTTPAGTFTNVLRMKIQRISTSNFFGIIEVDTIIQHAWFQEGNATPLLVYEHSLTTGDVSLNYAVPAIVDSSPQATPPIQTMLSVMPNPVQGSGTVHFSGFHGGEMVKVELVNVHGQVVDILFEGMAQGSIQESIELSFQDVPSGLYFLKMSGLEASVFSKKVYVHSTF